MLAYIFRRLLLIIPTLFGIMVLNFIIIQAAPGGPVEQMLAQIQGEAVDATARVSGTNAGEVKGAGGSGKYRGAQGLPPELIKEIEKQFGFDKPAHERFFQMLSNYTNKWTYKTIKSHFLKSISILKMIKSSKNLIGQP